jgi:hypothetical protein
MFCVSVKPWRHPDILIWVPSFWTLRTLGGCVWERSGTLLKWQGCHDLGLVRGHKGPVKGLRASGPQGLDPLFIVFNPELTDQPW